MGNPVQTIIDTEKEGAQKKPGGEPIAGLGSETTPTSTSAEVPPNTPPSKKEQLQIIHGHIPEGDPSKSLSKEPVKQPSTGNIPKDLTDNPEKIDTLTTSHKPTEEADKTENAFIERVQESVESIV